MKGATIRERRVLEGLQSASGLEHVGDSYYVISDDSPFLFRMNGDWKVVEKTRLFASDVRDSERIAKSQKPDLEALCLVEWHGRRELLCFGSGSKSPARDVCFRVDVTDANAPKNVRRVELTALYDSLRADPKVVGTRALNLEAACGADDKLFLFQRGNILGQNTLIEFELGALMEYLDAPQAPAPAPRVRAFALPRLQERLAGFSAATVVRDSLIFSAAVEDTDNEIDDGAKLGSFIGQITGVALDWIEPVRFDDEIARVKIEGIAGLSAGTGIVELVAVTDDDEGASEVMRIEISK
jgi:hypothetical protein